MGFGISIYPEHADFERNATYICEAGQRGATRVFSCLLSVTTPREKIVEEFCRLHDLMHEHGMEVILDVSPEVFAKLGLDPNDLSFFAEVRTDGIRLDEAFSGAQVAAMTRNSLGLKIEINASTPDGTLAATLANQPYRDRLLACHNFYPQRYSGLSREFFERETRAIKKLEVRTAAFVSCGNHDAFGPWPLRDGLPTLEEHRDLPLDLQARHLSATGLIDDIIISNCFPTLEELDQISSLSSSRVMFRAVPECELNETEAKILYEFPHRVRGDLSDYLMRSTMSRITYADCDIPAQNTRAIERGDVLIINNESARYKGELQLALRCIPNDGTRNVVAHLSQGEQTLMTYLTSWSSFGFLSQ